MRSDLCGNTSKMRRIVRAAVAAILAVGMLGACSAEGDIDTSGDGISVDADVDSKKP